MHTESILAQLQAQPFVREFTPTQVERLASLAKLAHFNPDRVLFREGEECAEFYLIVSGLVALEIVPPSGAFRVDTLGGGDELGWSSVLEGRERQFQARTLREVEALVFDGAALRALCDEDTAFGYALMRRLLVVVASRLQVTRLQLMDTRWPVAKRAGA
jgi:CRP-like cAMP-binding protein